MINLKARIVLQIWEEEGEMEDGGEFILAQTVDEVAGLWRTIVPIIARNTNDKDVLKELSEMEECEDHLCFIHKSPEAVFASRIAAQRLVMLISEEQTQTDPRCSSIDSEQRRCVFRAGHDGKHGIVKYQS